MEESVFILRKDYHIAETLCITWLKSIDQNKYQSTFVYFKNLVFCYLLTCISPNLLNEKFD